MKAGNTKHGEFYALLDALDMFETWFIAELPKGIASIHTLRKMYNQRTDKSRKDFKVHAVTLKTGFLFVRIE